jgi:hypothetical protein
MPGIIDFNHKKKQKHGNCLTGPCSHCRREIQYDLNEYVTFIKIFKMLFFPHNVTYRSECPICGFGNDISEKQFKDLKFLAELNSALKNGEISAKQYDQYRAKNDCIDKFAKVIT